MDRIARRDLLRGGAVVAALATMPLKLREAVGAPPLPPPRNLIVVLNSGGWDTTYTFDPKPGLKAVDAPAGKEQAFGGLRVFVDPSRPNVSDFFTRYGSIAAVVNGVQLLSFIHPDCTKRILTGAPSDVKPDVGAIAANDLGRDLPVPYLVLGNSAISGPLAAITGRAGTTNQIAALISPELAYGSVDTPYVPAPGLVCTAKENDFVRRYLEATSARLRATRGQHGANARQVDDFLKSLTRSDQLRAFAKSTPEGFGKRAYTPDLDVQVQIATKAMQSGLCHSVMLEMGNWDTHENNAQQGGYQNKLFGSMTR